jgi:class 3 adenylate cyclase
MGGPVTKNSFALTLPDGAKAKLVGVRYDGDLLPAALVFEVPADVKSVKIGVSTGTVLVSALGPVDLTAIGAPIDLPLDFG